MSGAAKEILDYERRVNAALRSLHGRTGFEPTAVESRTPLSSLLESEEGELDEWAVRRETVKRMFDFLLADGPEPHQILRRLFALGSHMGVEPFCLLTLREKALMMGDSHGAEHWRIQKICVDPLKRSGAHSVKAPGMKGIDAAAACSKAQKGNTNRKNGHRKHFPRSQKTGDCHAAITPTKNSPITP